jgi:NAD(P)-dependent dehydrogenase (short-subunit alcohol dehydrogenase family)
MLAGAGWSACTPVRHGQLGPLWLVDRAHACQVGASCSVAAPAAGHHLATRPDPASGAVGRKANVPLGGKSLRGYTGIARVDVMPRPSTSRFMIEQPAFRRRAVAVTVGQFGRLDILVNNAGLGPANPAEDVTEADVDLTVDVNVKGTFFASQAAGRVMIQQGFGRTVNLGSQAGMVALPTESVYCLTKAAISHLTRCLAVEWGRCGITVNTVAPTFIHTPGTAADLRRPCVPRRRRGADRRAHRIGEPMDVAGAVVFLASPAASLITGTTLLVDGGWTAR